MEVQRGDDPVVELIDRAEWVGMPAITLGELRTGFLLGGRREQNEAVLREFLSNPVVEELEVDGETSRGAGPASHENLTPARG